MEPNNSLISTTEPDNVSQSFKCRVIDAPALCKYALN